MTPPTNDGQSDVNPEANAEANPELSRLAREVRVEVDQNHDGGHFMGAGQAEGVIEYNDWKPPDAVSKTHNKTFYLEIENENWSSGVDGDSSYNYCIPPYYNMIWQMLAWYLDFGEFAYYRKNTNWSRIKEVVYQVNVVGHRLPFTTNEENSSVANSQVDQMLDIFRGLEKRHPHTTIYKNGLGDLQGTTLRRKNAYSNIIKTLYGYPNTRETGINKVSANRGYRRWRYFPKMYAKKDPQSSHPSANASWPSYASSKWQSVDLARYRGPVATIQYQTKGGILGQMPSIITQQHSAPDNLSYILETRRPINKTLTNTFITSTNRTKPVDFFNPSYFHCYANSTSDYHTLYSSANVDMEFQNNTRHDPVMPCYQSLFLGVRPQMNGATHQKGVLQLEIRTQCTVEFQLYFAVPINLTWKNDEEKYDVGNDVDHQADALTKGYTGLSNDMDLCRYDGHLSLPNYTAGNKLEFYDGTDLISHSRQSRGMNPNQYRVELNMSRKLVDTFIQGMDKEASGDTDVAHVQDSIQITDYKGSDVTDQWQSKFKRRKTV